MASYVAKVQFENSLRRLPLGVDPTSFSYSQLVGRTRDLFQIPTDAKLLLTYVDRDGDVVTMADDQDLQDAVVMQSLNPLRLNVVIVKNGVEAAADRSVAENSGTTAAAVAMSKLSSAKEKIGADEEQQESEEKMQAPVNNNVGDGNDNTTTVTAGPSVDENSKIDGLAAVEGELRSEGFTKDDAKQLPVENDDQTKSDDTDQEKADNNTATVGPEAPADATAPEAAEHQAVHHGIICDGCGMKYIRGPRYKSVRRENYDLCQKCFEKPGVDPNEFITFKKGRPYGVAFFVRGGRRGAAAGACPRMEKETTAQSTTPAATEGEAFHYGVVCDGCSTTPIVGPRFKSNKKDDYDLCQSCMQKVEGSASDEYTRIDRAVPPYPPHMFMGNFYRGFPPYALIPFMPFGRPWCSRRIPVTGGLIPRENDEANKKEVTKEGETDHKAEATSDPEKAQNEAQIVTGTQEAVTANADGTNASTEENTSKLPAQSETPKADDLKVEQAPEDVSTFDGMIAKLAAMGFTDKKLNEELLRRNNLDLRKTLDDLCAAEEWDPILEELQEMGFYDSDLNRRLLFQNKGNMKSVLKELVRMAKIGK